MRQRIIVTFPFEIVRALAACLRRAFRRAGRVEMKR